MYGAPLSLVLLCLSGCATLHPDRRADSERDSVAAVAPREMPVFDGNTGASTPWDALIDRASAADVVLVGEQHDDLPGHRFEVALTNALLERGPTAVCMEMFERDEQPLVDAYLAGAISQTTLVDLTDSRDWGAKGRWDDFYQPLVDAAKAAGAPVVAANAARRFPRLARLEGFAPLEALADDYPGHFVVPGEIEQDAYRERFLNTMRHHAAPQPTTPETRKEKTAAPEMPPVTEDMLASFFRAQQVWDATMADAVVRAQAAHGKALLVVGQFHIDHDGGLLLRLRAAAPALNILTISMDQETSSSLREEDAGRADFVVYRPDTANR